MRQIVARFPHRLAVTYLRDGEKEEERLTYADLDARARAIAVMLQEKGLTGERVLLAYPPGAEYICAFWACLYAGAAAVPIYPPRSSGRESSLARIRTVAADTGAQLALTTKSVLDAMHSSAAPVGESLFGTPLQASDDVPLAASERWEMPRIDRDTLAFLQYTSGSTSAPKGVMVSHGNILANQDMIGAAMELPDHMTLVGWLPVYHDMGLIGNVLAPLLRAGHVVLMSPVAFLQRPLRLLQAITKYRPYSAGGPNFGYMLCARKVTELQKASLDLSSWRSAFNGAERVSADTLETFASAFAPCGFRRESFFPCYGLAEGTLLVSGGPAHHGPIVKRLVRDELERGHVVEAAPTVARTVVLVSCGRIRQDVRIVDPETQQELEPGRVGEIWALGPNVAGGYWNRPEVSRTVFQATLADGTGAKYLRTGDLGFVDTTDASGPQLYVTGRLKDLIIVDGRNVYPEDVELTVERAHPEVRPGCCIAFGVVTDSTEDLVIVAEVEGNFLRAANSADRGREALVADLVKRIKATVSAEHEARVRDVALVTIGGVPKTSSGKLQRSACRAAFLENKLPRVGADHA
jgi:acyl-CoA synthetase (AMP-forming)/AMP-acid ligase II